MFNAENRGEGVIEEILIIEKQHQNKEAIMALRP
jgi:hypothetical protein